MADKVNGNTPTWMRPLMDAFERVDRVIDREITNITIAAFREMARSDAQRPVGAYLYQYKVPTAFLDLGLLKIRLRTEKKLEGLRHSQVEE